MANLLANANNWTDGTHSPPACWNGSQYVATNTSITLTFVNPASINVGDYLQGQFVSQHGLSECSAQDQNGFINDTDGNTLYTVPQMAQENSWPIVEVPTLLTFNLNAGEGCFSDSITIAFPSLAPIPNKVFLTWSDDGGHNWANRVIASAGFVGDTAQRVIFRRLGSTKRNTGLDRIFEVSGDDYNQVALVGASLNDG